jgi:hypothetical protein
MTRKKVSKSTETDARLMRDGLRAALIVCSKDECIVSLNAIRFEVGARNVRLVSTDGHRLLQVTLTLDSEKLGATRQFQISRADSIRFLRILSLESKSGSDVEIKDVSGNMVLLGLPDVKLKARRVDKAYPEYSTITPAIVDVVPEAHAAGFSGPYLKDLADIAAIVLRSAHGVGVRYQPIPRELDPMRFDITTKSRPAISAIYTLMPMRIN